MTWEARSKELREARDGSEDIVEIQTDIKFRKRTAEPLERLVAAARELDQVVGWELKQTDGIPTWVADPDPRLQAAALIDVHHALRALVASVEGD